MVYVCLGAAAQSVVKMPVSQNPLFEVSADNVAVAVPDGSDRVTLGADLVIAGGSGTYTYRWYTPSGDELGEMPTVEVEASGVYLLDITDTCDCLLTVRFDVATAGIDSAEAYSKIILSPNPADGIVEVEGFEPRQITLVDMSGRMAAFKAGAYGSSLSSFDVSTLAPGQYIVCMTDGYGRKATARLIRK